jgi:DNA-binding NarL/FixJ family response regulator
MQEHNIIGIVEAAYNLSETSAEAVRSIARAATSVITRGPIAIAAFGSGIPLGRTRVWFERADDIYVSRFAEWQREAPATVHRLALSFSPRAVQFRTSLCELFPAALQTLANRLFSLCILANTGDGGGLHIAFGNPDLDEWRPGRLVSFHQSAAHLAAAWRLRKALGAAAAATGFAAESIRNAGITGTGEEAPLTARDALRRAVVAHDRAWAARRTACNQELWPALIAGRWSLLDTFTATGTRYIVAHENPAGSETLRALSPRERSALEFLLAGRSGKWIAFEMQLSESVVTRTLRAAFRKVGVADAAALSGVQTARFESLEGLNAGVDLAVARLIPEALLRASLSDAERAIVDGLLGGKRIAVIARERGTSPRTVAHQITSTYQKLGVSSRRELFALFT